jgi:hypothetical protein
LTFGQTIKKGVVLISWRPLSELNEKATKMKNTKFAMPFFVILLGLQSVFAQDSLLVRLASDHTKLFSFEKQEFIGEGWDYIMDRVNKSANVLIGEDHFSNEIPAFFKAISNNTKFDNFYIELDPYSTQIIAKSFSDFSVNEREKFNSNYSSLFSFYALKPEYELLEHLTESGANLLGADQIVMYADRFIFQDIVNRTVNSEAKEIYKNVIQQSLLHLEKFYENPQNPMYFMTEGFSNQLGKLEDLDLSEDEDLIIADMRRSVTIYKEQSHKKRVKLILHQLMKDYPKWNNSKNLFKYGANHMARGESLLTVFDIGNLVASITRSNYEESFHIMIVGKSGMLGSPLKGFPATPVDAEEGFYLKHLKPFFKMSESSQWQMFDMIPLRKAVEKNVLKIENVNLLRVIKGFDVLVIIPEITPARF